MDSLAADIEKILDHEDRTEEDSVLLSPVCTACLGKKLVIGKNFNLETYAEKECLFIAE
jgi:CRISPR-associated protein Cas2